jgi:antitoxin ParD1/3/4
MTETRKFDLPAEQASYIDSLVASGVYGSGSEVVRAGIEALQDRDAALQDWLRNDVAPVYDAMQADPNRGIPAEQVQATLRAHQAARMKAGRE